ncbi:glucose 1-dehydrogenase [Nemorincola caseinilytica]|uniref:Glucose 1-dehydrogenase n=1 Tax=Nemorincola caseinilytica TaxID=2054315 RepID=A0ABP8NJD2_9BACT
MKKLQNKVAIVTGAAGGIGAAIALLFAEEGANVMATDLQQEKMATWADAAGHTGLVIAHLQHDVASWDSWQNVVKTTLALYGKIDILINNAGIYPPGVTTEATSKELWDKVIGINLTGPFIGTQLCVPHMRAVGGGAIVNISSIAGIVGGNGAAYSASKGGLRLLTKDNAVEFAKDHIRVNSIHPGGVITPMTEAFISNESARAMIKNICPMERMANAVEIAYGALYLAGADSSYVTGTELVIDGGLTAR